MLGFGAALLWRRPTVLAVVAATVWSADLVSFGIKVLVDRPRPFVGHPEPPPLTGVIGYSFPSGHAATAFAGALVLTRYLPRRWPALFLLAVAIAYSRVYVGVHYPGDVLGGAALGLTIAAASLRLAGPQRPPPGSTALPQPAAGPRRSRRSQPPG